VAWSWAEYLELQALMTPGDVPDIDPTDRQLRTGPVDLELPGDQRAVRAECATYSGYRRHQRAGEPACDACKAAAAERAKSWRASRQPAA
jgi:hypothetical protein